MNTDAEARTRAGRSESGAPGVARRNPRFPVGVNYYPLDSEVSTWEEWYAGDVDGDFAAFAAAGLTLVRIFISWKLFEPQVDRYSEQATDRLRTIVDAAAIHGLRLMVCFFADDRHADLLDVVWARKRDPRTDSYLIERETALVRHIVERHRADRAVFAWELANEVFCCGFESAQALESWAATLREAVRELDPDRPVMLSFDPETLFHAARVDGRGALRECEIAVSHPTMRYRTYAAEGPIASGSSTYLDSFLLHMGPSGKPVLFDDVGSHMLEDSHAEEAAALRCALYSGLMNGASGALVRRWRDMATDRREPYFVDPYEAVVGVCDSGGEPKAAMRELDAFTRMAAHLDLQTYELTAERMAVVVPAERRAALPALASLYTPRACLESYIRAKEAHVPVTMTHEDDEFDPFAVLIVPSVTDLSDTTWERLGAWVQVGGSLVFSYGGGEFGPAAREIFGVDFLGHGGARTRATCRIAQQNLLGALEPFEVAAEVPHFALLGAGTSTVIATDSAGSPLVTLNRYGQGRAICVAAPFERVLGQAGLRTPPAEVQTFLRILYGAVADVAGCGPLVDCDAPGVEVALFAGEEDDVLLLLNHMGEPVTASVGFVVSVASVTDIRGGAPVAVGGRSFSVPLGQYGVMALRLCYA
ncbi:MAG: cellulase family glycosylhydrolase [Coriobacteriia bacterium]|nr:cellulase family glycosylhydrolase [Coriobacteriia bacterium]